MTFDRTDETRTQSDRPRTRDTDRRSDGRAGRPSYGRRRFLRAAGGVAVGGFLAGCTSDGGDGSGSGGGEPTDGGPETVDEWLSDTDNYDSVAEMTGESTVTVEVGARGNNGSNAFAPPAVEVSPGTTVVWEWVEGYHNVVSTDGAVDSGSPEKGASFEYTFESPGVTRYYCEPHESVGMKGAIVVSEADDGSSANESEASR
ncbi:halocyanin domain-containing protein [Halopelagius fulvigenes]|uniref:Halocyanin domain-containing protein n=1 Tax=Halopelagius fulvigenes TaxID=1198324 RepID=A0ABD5U1F0_9EURY